MTECTCHVQFARRGVYGLPARIKRLLLSDRSCIIRISAILSNTIDAQHSKSVKLQVSSPEDTHNFYAAPDAPGAHQVKQKYISTGVFKDF